MKIIAAADHGGFNLKNILVERLKKAGHEVTDIGTQSSESTDYPDYAHKVASAVADGTAERGLLVCGSGVGMAIAANRHKGVRAVNCSDTFTARYSRMHNDANILTLGERVVGPGLAADILDLWISTPFSKDESRHATRVAKIEL
jgi:ribose 5-phosphate isomerase B